MRVQIISDLHLETETYRPEPSRDAELLILAGDIDSTWTGLELFRGWPVPVLFVAGNHEFDHRDLATTWLDLRKRCTELGFRMLERESAVITGAGGERVRFVATVRWCDLDLFENSSTTIAQRERVMRSAEYFMKVMGTTHNGRPFDATAVREEGLACRAWLASGRRTKR